MEKNPQVNKPGQLLRASKVGSAMGTAHKSKRGTMEVTIPREFLRYLDITEDKQRILFSWSGNKLSLKKV